MSSDRIWPTGNNDLDKQAFNRSKLRSSLGKRSDTLAGKKSREETESDYPEDEKHFGSGAGKRRKNEPDEITAKIPVKRLGPQSISGITEKPKPIDPRFSATSGPVSHAAFERNYAFLDEMKKEELAEIRKRMKEERDPEIQRKLQSIADKYSREIKTKEEVKEEKELLRSYMHTEREAVAKGKKPFFLKKKDIKQLGAAKKFMQLEQTGRLDRTLSKKRQKIAAKDRKYMPSDK